MIREYIIPIKCSRLNNFVNEGRTHPMTVEAIIQFNDDNTNGIVKSKGIMCNHYSEGLCKDRDKPTEKIPCFYASGFKPFPLTSQ